MGHEADPGKECCDEESEEDGRQSDGRDHKGDWGKHLTNQQIDELDNKKLVLDTHIEKV